MNQWRAALTVSLWTLINVSVGCTGGTEGLGGPVTVGYQLPADFNGDGNPDFLWHNGTTGATQAWSMSGTTRTATQSFDSSLNVTDSSGWVPVGSFFPEQPNGSSSEVLWHNGATGALQQWEMNYDGTRASVVNGAPALNLPDSSGWQLVATGTFEHTSPPPTSHDFVWHNGVTGATQVWFMSAGLIRNSFANLDSSLNVPDSTGWRIVGANDYNGDNWDDLVWHNGTTGQTQIWYMTGATRTSVATLDASLNVTDSTGWRIVGVSNLFGNTTPDLVWHNGSTGETQIWYMTGVTRTSFATLPASLDVADSTGWHIVRF